MLMTLCCILSVSVCYITYRAVRIALHAYITEDTRSVALPANSLTTEEKVKLGYFQSQYKKTKLALGDSQFDMQIADTSELQELGLSYRTGLEKNNGMIFVFQKDNYYPFWMKDMSFDIDMIWVNSTGKVTYIVSGAKPDSYPTTYQAPELSRYVIELPTGAAAENNIKVGDLLSSIPKIFSK